MSKWTPAIAYISPLIPSDLPGPPLTPRKSRTQQSCLFLVFLIQNPYSKSCQLRRATLCCANILTLKSPCLIAAKVLFPAYSKCVMAHGSQDSSLISNGSGTLLLCPVTPSSFSWGTESWTLVYMLLNSPVFKWYFCSQPLARRVRHTRGGGNYRWGCGEAHGYLGNSTYLNHDLFLQNKYSTA